MIVCIVDTDSELSNNSTVHPLYKLGTNSKLVENDARIATIPVASVDAVSSINPLKINSGTNAKFA